MKDIVVKKIFIGVVVVLVIFVILEGIFLINISKRINELDSCYTNRLASQDIQHMLELEDRIWPGVSYNPNKIGLFLYHKNGPIVNGPFHEQVYKSIAYYWTSDLFSYSCADESKYLSHACRIVFKDRIKDFMPKILADEESLSDITLKDKHVEEMYKSIISRPPLLESMRCSGSYHKMQQTLEENKKIEKRCYQICKKKHSKKECLGDSLG